MSVTVANLQDRQAWRDALTNKRPFIAHLNADTSWLVQLPSAVLSGNGSKRRTRYNILIDPWLRGPQSDFGRWYSTQWHVVPPAVESLAELNKALAEVEEVDHDESSWHIDLVVISHEFTDHCHQATLLELPKSIPIVATETAASLIKSWNHFDTVIVPPQFSSSSGPWRDVLVDKTGVLPPWLGIGRVVTWGEAIMGRLHSALVIAFDLMVDTEEEIAITESSKAEAVIYTPHGIQSSNVDFLQSSGDLSILALLHGLHDVRVFGALQINLGEANGLEAAIATKAKYWIPTHDEVKRATGLVSWFLQRSYNAVDAEDANVSDEQKGDQKPCFVELQSGRGLLLL